MSAFALDPDRAIRQLSHVWYEDQLPQSTVLAIAQRPDGSIWLSTYGGLVHHSGAEFDEIDQRAAPVLRSSAITTVAVDREGMLWVGTLNGGLYRSADGRELQDVPLPASTESVFGIVEDKSGALWLTTNSGVVRKDATGMHLFGPETGFPRGFYRGIVADDEGGVWVAADGVGVAHWRDGKVEIFDTARGLPSNAVYCLTIDHAGTVWAGTQSGPARYRYGRFERDPRLGELDATRIFSLLGDRDGSLWLAPLGIGICRLTSTHLECDNNLGGLGGETVRSMFEDREGNIWMGTTSSGVHRFSDSKLITVVGKMASNSVRAVYQDSKDTLWVGTDGGGLAAYRNQTLEPADALNEQLLSRLVRAIAGDDAGNLWVGTTEGVSRVSPNGEVRNFGIGDGLPGTIVFAFAASRDGGMWVATLQGVAKISGDKVSVVEQTRGNDVRALYEGADGRLWIGERGGLRCLRNDALDSCGTDGLPHTSVFVFHPAADGSMWLGTSVGLVRLREGKTLRYASRAGFFGDAVFTILEDQKGYFWVSSNRGIAKLSLRDLEALDSGEKAKIEPVWYGKNDGMLSPQANGASQTPGWQTRDRRMWIGTSNGVVIVDPEGQRVNSLPPPVAVERMLVDGADVAPGNAPQLGPGIERVEFHYAAMSYVAPAAVRYRYRMEGFDRDWVDAGGSRAAYYTNLPAGDYVFHVVASNNDRVWNDVGASVHFSIVPMWYDSLWFRAALALAALGLVVAVYQLRVWRIGANERSLMREVAVRTDALRAANAELRRLASLDGLTHIANRSAFEERLASSWEDHRRRHAPLALLLCDIDAFKAYNDTYGHPAGDATLTTVARAFASAARSNADLAARYGGEEFALLLPDCGVEEAAAVARRVGDAVRALAIDHRSSDVAAHVTISTGIAVTVPGAGEQPDVLVGRADEALYRAKAQGRDRVSGPEGS